MTDFSWMRSGKAGLGAASGTGPSVDTMRRIAALVKVLLKQSFETAACFARACGRDTITDYDLHFSLKYESEAFWSRPFDDDYFTALSEEQNHTYDTSDEEEDGEEEDGEEEDGEEEDAPADMPTFECVAADPALCALHGRVLDAVRAWDDWQPTDPAKRLLRNAIEKTSTVLPAYTLPA